MRGLGLLFVGLVGGLVLTACGDGGEAERPAAPAATPAPVAAPAPAQTTGPQVSARLVEVEASVFKFTPKRLVLKAGEPVQFRVTSKDTIHTFRVKDLGIHLELSPGQTKVSAVFTPQKTGTFQVTCGIHSVSSYGMEGFLEVRK